MTYAIWDHIPEKGKRAAAEALYVEVPTRFVGGTARQSLDGRCPLGVAMRACGLTRFFAPSPRDVVVGLLGMEHPYRGYRALTSEARAFISDWDNGRIPLGGVAAAIGWTPEEPTAS
jgi:hypothetical protein